MKNLAKTSFLLFIILVGFWGLKGADSRGAPEKRAMLSSWQPNQTTSEVKYVGARTCAQCHSEIFRNQTRTSMGTALEHAAHSVILRSYPRLEFRSGPYLYRIVREGERSIYTVTDGAETISEAILWSFGHGVAGQTYVFQHEGKYYESRVSFFTEIKTLDYTLGHPRQPASSLAEAMGRRLTSEEVRRCISCHSTAGASGKKLDLENLEAGVRCEACHGPGAKHVLSMRVGSPGQTNIFNPGKLSADSLSQEFCGACHRSAEEVVQMERRGGDDNIRFQPYRIFNSRCYSDDPRISCIACHNPHESLRRESGYYDSRCLACHRKLPSGLPANEKRIRSKGQLLLPTAPPCRVDQRHCVTCHMPKLGLPGSHFEFTDHRIRIPRPGAPYPN
jgi:hypothetical protein